MAAYDKEVAISSGNVKLPGNLRIPHGATGIVVFVHGSGSSRHRYLLYSSLNIH